VNDRKLFLVFGLLRNSTIFAAQKLGFGQCSQTAPVNKEKLKQRPDCSQTGFKPSQTYHRGNNLDKVLNVRAKSWLWGGTGVH
jgi:hypothetical protein